MIWDQRFSSELLKFHYTYFYIIADMLYSLLGVAQISKQSDQHLVDFFRTTIIVVNVEDMCLSKMTISQNRIGRKNSQLVHLCHKLVKMTFFKTLLIN